MTNINNLKNDCSYCGHCSYERRSTYDGRYVCDKGFDIRVGATSEEDATPMVFHMGSEECQNFRHFMED